jgi:L-fuconolactonase
VLAVVGWTDLTAPDAPSRIATLARRPKLRGLRPMLQALADDAWILHPALAPAIEAMIDQGLSFDALVLPRHLPSSADLRPALARPVHRHRPWRQARHRGRSAGSLAADIAALAGEPMCSASCRAC